MREVSFDQQAKHIEVPLLGRAQAAGCGTRPVQGFAGALAIAARLPRSRAMLTWASASSTVPLALEAVASVFFAMAAIMLLIRLDS